MITCNLMGGLGNQLFQIYTTIAYALKLDHKFIFENKEILLNHTNRPTYWNTFLKNLKQYTVSDELNFTRINENGFQYNILPTNVNKDQNILIFGYFQSYKYFIDYYQYISELIDIEGYKQDNLKKMDCSNMISIHFRIGDYKRFQDCHPILPYDYYKNCINYIIEHENNDTLHIVYFCEEQDIQEVSECINRLKEQFPNCQFLKADSSLLDWEQMIMMSCCKHNIIANSSFSWWGAYFNSNSDKIVCYPSVWFGVQLAQNKLDDLFPDEWIKIDITKMQYSKGLNNIDLVYYINLDHREDRYTHINNQLKSTNIESRKIHKISGVYVKNLGELGCAKSHALILEKFLNSPITNKYCLILEDDFEFTESQDKINDSLDKIFNEVNFDLLFLASALIKSENIKEKEYILKVINSQTTSAYIVNRNYAKTLLCNYNESISELEKIQYEERKQFYSYAIDQNWKKLQPKSKWYVINPKVGKQIESFSDIQIKVTNYNC